MQSGTKCGFLEFFTKETVCVTKLDDITIFRPIREGENFLFLSGTVKSNLISIYKGILELLFPKECSLFYYIQEN